MSPKFICTFVLGPTLFALGCEKDNSRSTSPVTTREMPAAASAVVVPSGPVGHHTGDNAPVVQTMAAAPAGTSVATGSDREADAEFKSAPGMKVDGDVEFKEIAGGVHITVEVEGAPPGEKGIHIHQTDNCSDIPNKSMGEHFAPTIPKHGLPGSPEHHLGDLGNITIDKDGNGKLEITVMNANLKPGDALSFVGRSVVLHESNDKGTGPSGDAGKPIACAPIRAD